MNIICFNVSSIIFFLSADDVVWPSLQQTTTATLEHPIEENYDTKEMSLQFYFCVTNSYVSG